MMIHSKRDFVARIRAAHTILVEIAQDLRRANDLDHAEDMSKAAMYCRAAANDISGSDANGS